MISLTKNNINNNLFSVGAELSVSIGGCNGQISSTLSLQQAVTGILTLDNISVSTYKVTFSFYIILIFHCEQ